MSDEKPNNLISRSKEYLYSVFNDKKNVDGLIKGIIRANGCKYNTEKCISDFYC